MNSACKCALLLPMDWHAQLTRDFSYSIALKAFYNIFLVTLLAAVGQPYVDVLTCWWRHAAMRTMAARVRACLVSKCLPHKPSHQLCMGTMMAGHKSSLHAPCKLFRQLHPLCQVQCLRLACSCCALIWSPSMLLVKQES